MPKLTQEEKNKLAPIIPAFGRNTRKPPEEKVCKDGETNKTEFEHLIHPGDENKNPLQFVSITAEEVQTLKKKGGQWREKAFLWVIDEETVKFLREKNRNRLRTHKPEHVCHTNLTGNTEAYIGGEMYFCEDGRKFINPFSDRYGNPSISQWVTAKTYIQKVGYTPLIDIIDLLAE
jgi:hypothetical protein